MIKLFNMNDVSIIGWGITITIAVVGWGIAIIQALKNRNLQKEIVHLLRENHFRAQEASLRQDKGEGFD